jgi:hypothetical protein
VRRLEPATPAASETMAVRATKDDRVMLTPLRPR